MANFRQKEKVVDPTAVPTGIDTQTIFSPTIPDEVKLGVRVMHHTNISVLQSITKHVLDYISLDVLPSQDYCFDYQSYEVDFSSNSVLDNVSNSVANSASNSANSTITITDLNLLIAFIHLLLRTLIRQKLKLSEVKEQLTLMNFPAEFVVIVCKVVMKFRMKLESVLITNRVHFPQLQKVRWRIDVVISSGLLSRIMRPTILLQVMQLLL